MEDRGAIASSGATRQNGRVKSTVEDTSEGLDFRPVF
jgi:hypothetical protein